MLKHLLVEADASLPVTPSSEKPAEVPAAAPADPATPAEPVAPSSGEYDFTKDFREFEDTVNVAKNEAKKKFLDKLNQAVSGKGVTVNASRGYGQPQKDYNVDKVSSAAVEWYYNKNVVILKDPNGKEYFLTPGVNIKLGAEGAEASKEEPAVGGPSQAPKEPTPPPVEPTAEPIPPAVEPSVEPPQAEKPTAPTAPTAPVAPEVKPEVPKDPRDLEDPDKKKEPIKEEQTLDVYKAVWIQHDVGSILCEFIKDEYKDKSGKVNTKQYIKDKPVLENVNDKSKATFRLTVPMAHIDPLDVKDLQLAVRNEFRSYGGPGGTYSNGWVNVEKVGNNYIMDFEKTVGLNT